MKVLFPWLSVTTGLDFSKILLMTNTKHPLVKFPCTSLMAITLNSILREMLFFLNKVYFSSNRVYSSYLTLMIKGTLRSFDKQSWISWIFKQNRKGFFWVAYTLRPNRYLFFEVTNTMKFMVRYCCLSVLRPNSYPWCFFSYLK